MNVTFDIGASADLASGEELRQGVSDMKTHITHALKHTKQRPVYRPDLLVSAVCGGTSAGSLSLQPVYSGSVSAYILQLTAARPAQGRLWNVVSVSVTGYPTPSSVVTGASCEIYAGDPNIPNASGLLGIGTQIPVGFTFSSKCVWMHAGQQIYALLYGVTSGASITMSAAVIDYEDSAVEASSVPIVGG